MRDCPGEALEIRDKKAEYIRKCIQCGHCVAVCPVRAVSIPEYDMDEVEEYDKDTFSVDPEHFLHAVKFRRSTRNFKEAPIEREKLECILAAGRYTPTAKNTQGCRFVLIRDEMEEFKSLFWKELPAILGVMKEEAPLYERIFRGFLDKYQKDPKDDTFFFNATSFLVITSKNPLDGGLAAANIETWPWRRGPACSSAATRRRLWRTAVCSGSGLASGRGQLSAVCLWAIRLSPTKGQRPAKPVIS